MRSINRFAVLLVIFAVLMVIVMGFAGADLNNPTGTSRYCENSHHVASSVQGCSPEPFVVVNGK